MRYNIAISGVGGLGILTLGRIFSRAAMLMGKRVIMSEIHGLAQRYGAVFVHVRMSDGEDLAPTIPRGKAHLLVALEPVEGLRVADVLGGNTIAIINTNVIYPPTVAIGLEDYPNVDDILSELRSIVKNVYAFNALEIAKKYGDPRVQNTVLLGMASKIPGMPLSNDAFINAIEKEFAKKPKVLEINLKAFEEGQKIMENTMQS